MKKNRLIQTTACAMALSAALTVSAFAATNVTATLRPDVTVRIDGYQSAGAIGQYSIAVNLAAADTETE